MNAEINPPEAPEQFDPVECKHYIVEVIGNQERFPEREPYQTGLLAAGSRLLERYGEDWGSSFCRIFREFLEDPDEGTMEERAIWSDWRREHAAKVVGVHPSTSSWTFRRLTYVCIGFLTAGCCGEQE